MGGVPTTSRGASGGPARRSRVLDNPLRVRLERRRLFEPRSVAGPPDPSDEPRKRGENKRKDEKPGAVADDEMPQLSLIHADQGGQRQTRADPDREGIPAEGR